MIIERGDYPTLTKTIVQAQLRNFAKHLQEALYTWCKAGGDVSKASFASEVDNNGVQLFWVEPAHKLDGRPAVAWTISAAGVRCSSGELGKLLE